VIRRHFWYWLAYGVALTAVTVAGLEVLSASIVPPWPTRELRAVKVGSGVGHNSWGMRDRERTIAKPAGTFRTVLIGDSFLEGARVTKALGERMEDDWAAAGRHDMEAVNLGVSATGPAQYFHRIRNVALDLQPDAIVLVFFAGNDFVSEPFGRFVLPAIAERPLPSLLGTVAPRLTWLAVNSLGHSEFGKATAIDDFAEVNAVLDLPRAERTEALVKLLKQRRLRDKDEQVIREVVGRAGDSFWSAYGARDRDQEHLGGWIFGNLVDWETATWSVPLTSEAIERSPDPASISATLTWLVAARDLARQRGVPFMIAFAPSPAVDAAFVDYWRPWPQYRSYFLQRVAWLRALRAELHAASVPFADLSDDLQGIAGTYRLTDGHWTELGTEIAARRIADEVLRLRTMPTATNRHRAAQVPP
jgi:lysophospholipase L1-like esterase